MPFASLTHLVMAMLQLSDCDGTRFVYPYEHARVAAVDRLSKEPDLRRSDGPHPDLDMVTMILEPRSEPSLFGRLSGRVFRRMSRLARAGPLFAEVATEQVRQAVRLGHAVVGPAHTMLAMLALDAALAGARVEVPATHAGRNRGAAILRHFGVNVVRLRERAERDGAPEAPPAEQLASQLSQMRLGDPFEGAAVGAAQERAQAISLAYRHADTGTSHLLLALIEDDEGDGTAVVRELAVDPAAVRACVQQDLEALPRAWPEPSVRSGRARRAEGRRRHR